MTGQEFRAALAALGLSQQAFATRFGVHFTNVSRWISGKTAVPPWVPAVIELLQQENIRDGQGD